MGGIQAVVEEVALPISESIKRREAIGFPIRKPISHIVQREERASPSIAAVTVEMYPVPVGVDLPEQVHEWLQHFERRTVIWSWKPVIDNSGHAGGCLFGLSCTDADLLDSSGRYSTFSGFGQTEDPHRLRSIDQETARPIG
jgi:hypothetical protein